MLAAAQCYCTRLYLYSLKKMTLNTAKASNSACIMVSVVLGVSEPTFSAVTVLSEVCAILGRL